jgi:hypothetical protein
MFENGNLPVGYVFAEDGAVVRDADAWNVLDELRALAGTLETAEV